MMMKHREITMHLKTSTKIILPIIAATLLTGCLNEVSDQRVAEIVEKTLMEKPEIIINSLEAFRENEQAKQVEQQKSALKDQKEALFNDKHSLILGNPDGDVTIVAFKDYRCGYCKKVWPTVQELIKKDKNIRIVFKEYPVLGPASEMASRYALASSLQGNDKYKAFNHGLMKHRGPMDEKTLKKIAASFDIDGEKLAKEANGKFVSDAIAKNRELGQKLAIQGTPAFVVGEELIPGAVPLNYLEELVKKARENKG